MRQVIRTERERDQQRLQAAQAEVQKAQNQVNTLDAQIDQMRRTIQAERARDTARIQAAQREVQKAQDEVNRLQSESNRAKDRIAALQRAIKAKEQWYNNLGFWDKANPANWGAVVAENTPRIAEISGLGIETGALEAAKHTAWGILEAAKGVLRGIEAGAKTFPINADPRMVGLLTAHGSAWAVLEAAKGVLRGIEAAAQTVPIEADPRMVGLFTAYGTATGALQVAQGVLEGTKLTVGGLADVGQFILDVGLGGLIDVKSASFRTSLAAANGGRVAMSIDVLFMKKERRTLTLDFSFADPLSAANALAKALLPA
jgi:multidrug efflux pump subunit AcrA (membrane-fusion protein)